MYLGKQSVVKKGTNKYKLINTNSRQRKTDLHTV